MLVTGRGNIMRTGLRVLVGFVVLLLSTSTLAAPRQLPIAPIPQRADRWCWAAVSEMVFRHYGVPALNLAGEFQCAIVGGLGGPCYFDCQKCDVTVPSLTALAMVMTGYPMLARNMIGRDVPRIRLIAREAPLAPDEVRAELNAGRPVVAAITPSGMPLGPTPQHVALIIGYEDLPGGGLALIVNDPWPYQMPDDPYIMRGAQAVAPGQYRIDYSTFRTRLAWQQSVYQLEPVTEKGTAKQKATGTAAGTNLCSGCAQALAECTARTQQRVDACTRSAPAPQCRLCNCPNWPVGNFQCYEVCRACYQAALDCNNKALDERSGCSRAFISCSRACKDDAATTSVPLDPITCINACIDESGRCKSRKDDATNACEDAAADRETIALCSENDRRLDRACDDSERSCRARCAALDPALVGSLAEELPGPLRRVLDAAPGGFATLKTTRSAAGDDSSWRTSLSLPGFNRCEVSTNGEMSDYTCKTYATQSREAAYSRYEKLLTVVRATLPADWTAKSSTPASGRRSTTFTPPHNGALSVAVFVLIGADDDSFGTSLHVSWMPTPRKLPE